MGLQTLVLTIAVLATGVMLVRAMLRDRADAARSAGGWAVVSAALVVLLLGMPFSLDRPEAHERANCGSALAPDRRDQFQQPREPVTECRQAYTARIAEAAALGALAVTSVTVVAWRRRN